MNTSTILKCIHTERLHQIRKWGYQKKELGTWLLVLEAELEEAKHAHVKDIKTGRDSAVYELIQVAACAISALESISDDDWNLFAQEFETIDKL